MTCFLTNKIAARLVFVVIVCSCCAHVANSDDKPAFTARAAWTTSRLRGTPEPPAPYRISPAFPGIQFNLPTSIEEIPGENRILITERDGKIISFSKTARVQRTDLVGDLVDLLPSALATQGVSLFHATLHPDFSKNRAMFVCYVHPGQGGHSRVSQFMLSDGSPPRLIPGSERVVITWPSGGHNAGCLGFGQDGNLYISTGDGTGPNPPDGRTTGQDLSDLLGAILRIDVDTRTGDRPYSIPADNPFVDRPGARPEIWAYGLRNPWKFGVDSQTGAMFAADNGWESWEMIHRIVRGGNCGWPIMEGRAVLRSEVKQGPTQIRPPVKDHPHTEANSVIGGPVYRGRKLPELQGSFVYADYITGTIWALKPEEDGPSYSHSTLVDTDQRIVALTQGSGGELFVVDYDFTGQVYELLPSGLPDTSSNFPRRLRDTGLFANLEKLEPAKGVVPYNVRVNLWSDGARAQRWVGIPDAGQIRLSGSADRPAVYPEGTVFIKHLSLPGTPDRRALQLETQILHFENRQWRPYSYLWNEAGTEANLVGSIGANQSIQVPDAAGERTWHVGAQNECRLCHNAGSHFVLGFVPSQLNRHIDGDVTKTNSQLAALVTQKVITSDSSVSVDATSRLVDPHDISQDLDDRARSYLHTNCSMCHHPGGNAIVSFYLRRDLPLDKLNTNKGTGIGTFGMRDAKIITPSDPFRSVLMYRMSKLGYARMPYIGSQMVDSAGVALIERWIRSLSGTDAKDLSRPLSEGSAESESLRLLGDRGATDRARRDSAIRKLVESTEGSLALISKMHSGSLDLADYRSAIAIGYQSSHTNIRGLFEHFMPESKRRATLGPNIDPQSVLSRKGVPGRGKLIFFSDAARCRACHDIKDPQKSTGPTLAEIIKKYPRRSEMLQHILEPSLKIDKPFVTYVVVTDEGRVIPGLKVEQNADEIVLKTAEGKLARVALSNLDTIQATKRSLMPDRILSDLTAQEAADLLAYILSLGPAVNEKP